MITHEALAKTYADVLYIKTGKASQKVKNRKDCKYKNIIRLANDNCMKCRNSEDIIDKREPTMYNKRVSENRGKKSMIQQGTVLCLLLTLLASFIPALPIMAS